jgi:hypothetical protein
MSSEAKPIDGKDRRYFPGLGHASTAEGKKQH